MTQAYGSRGNARFAIAKVRGRFHGVEVEWTRDRFADVIRRDVAQKAARGWSYDRIWHWVKSAYELDQRSADLAKGAVDTVIRPPRSEEQEGGGR